MCGIGTCPVHTRTTVIDKIEANRPARAMTYEGDYIIASVDNPDFDPSAAMLSVLLGTPAENLFIHLVVKVGPDKSIGDVMDEGNLEKLTVFRETFLAPSDKRLEDGAQESIESGTADTSLINEVMTTILHESHDMVVQSVKDGTIS